MEKEKKIDDRQFGFKKERHNRYNIKKQKFERKEKTAAIFFDKINKTKTFEQLKNIGIQGRMMEIIRELISDR